MQWLPPLWLWMSREACHESSQIILCSPWRSTSLTWKLGTCYWGGSALDIHSEKLWLALWKLPAIEIRYYVEQFSFFLYRQITWWNSNSLTQNINIQHDLIQYMTMENNVCLSTFTNAKWRCVVLIFWSANSYNIQASDILDVSPISDHTRTIMQVSRNLQSLHEVLSSFLYIWSFAFWKN